MKMFLQIYRSTLRPYFLFEQATVDTFFYLVESAAVELVTILNRDM